MMKILKHGKDYEKRVIEAIPHIYRCGWLRSCNEQIGGCGCTFEATLADFTYMVVGHGMMDYVAKCPECGRSINDSLNRVD